MRLFWVLLVLTISATAAEISFGSLNAFHLFDPSLDRTGVAASSNRYGFDVYQRKVENLGGLIAGESLNVVSLQEVGGREEVAALAKACGFQFSFVKGRDTYTGQNVGILSNVPRGYRLSSAKRVGELDRVLSKHAMVRVSAPDSTRPLYALAVHLLRPIGENKARQEAQLKAIGVWADTILRVEPSAVLVVFGDFNSRDISPAGIIRSEQAPVQDVGFKFGSPGTHLDGKPYDRIIVIGDGVKIEGFGVKRPPYGKRPNDTNRLLWSDHFLVHARITY